jgi:DNA-binding GntR family transcriptional regulator
MATQDRIGAPRESDLPLVPDAPRRSVMRAGLVRKACIPVARLVHEQGMPTSADISARIVEAVMARKLEPGARLGEQQLAMLFDCSRTIVREALMRLAARGMVTVSARRGWYVVEPSQDEAREAFEARRVIETGLIRTIARLDKPGARRLRAHLAREQAAVRGDDVGLRSFLLGDFHVCLAECLGNSLLADTLRDFTARTTLIAMRYQTSRDAAQSCAEHVAIVQALEAGDAALAERLMGEHLRTWQDKLRLPDATEDPLADLRRALAPIEKARDLRTSPAPAPRKPRPDPRSTYLGELL